jgi:hypothetical protein
MFGTAVVTLRTLPRSHMIFRRGCFEILLSRPKGGDDTAITVSCFSHRRAEAFSRHFNSIPNINYLIHVVFITCLPLVFVWEALHANIYHFEINF